MSNEVDPILTFWFGKLDEQGMPTAEEFKYRRPAGAVKKRGYTGR
jgi:hypothetical protein